MFITGCTGFIGKVILEKFLRDIQSFKRIYVMVRAKKGVPLLKRLEEIFKYEIFEPLFQKVPELRNGWKAKVFPIAGDLTLKGLGLSAEHKNILMNEVDVVINSAASTNFDDPILESLNINYFGALRMMDLVEESNSIVSLTHVSTAYVNSNRFGLIEEKIYKLPNGRDAEEYVSDILKLSPEQCQQRKKDIIGAYPNTYTFTKSCAERVIQKRLKSSKKRVALVRPSIVLSALREPLIGWTETLSAGQVLFYAMMAGLVKWLHTASYPLDVVPCDIVSNMIIAATAYIGQTSAGTLKLFHCTSSYLNPSNFPTLIKATKDYYRFHPLYREAFKPSVTSVQDEKLHAWLSYFNQELPLQVMGAVAKLPYVGSEKMSAQIELGKKMVGKMKEVQ